MKIRVAAIQMCAEPLAVAANLERADSLLLRARNEGVELAVLPEMFNTGYGLQPDYLPLAEGVDGPTLGHLSMRSREWRIGIAGGFVEREGKHLYDSVGFCLPDGQIHVYRKRHLVFWERFRFRPGRRSLIVSSPWGRIGFAICADMIYRSVWNDYRGRIDAAIVVSAWPHFTCRLTGRKHWLFGQIGQLSGEIPRKVALDLGIPVIFANQCGTTHTTIPLLGAKIADHFAGLSSICDGRHGSPIIAHDGEQVVVSNITIHSPAGPKSCRTTFPSVTAGFSSGSGRS